MPRHTCTVQRHTDTHTNLRLVDCRVLCCRFAPVQVWASNHNRGCVFCLASDTVPPSFVSPFHKSVSTENKGRECVKNTVLSRHDLFFLNHFTLRHPLVSHRAPLRCEPLRLTLSHLTLLDCSRLVQMCTLSGRHDSEIIPRLLDTNDVSTLSSIPTLDITLQKNKETGVALSVQKTTSSMASFPLLYGSTPLNLL